MGNLGPLVVENNHWVRLQVYSEVLCEGIKWSKKCPHLFRMQALYMQLRLMDVGVSLIVNPPTGKEKHSRWDFVLCCLQRRVYICLRADLIFLLNKRCHILG